MASPRSGSAALVAPNNWIIGPREDILLFLFTPVIMLALVLFAQSFWSMAALSAFATVLAMGHYLPGMMRAYGDPVLFRRFKWRFLLAPIFFVSAAMYFANLDCQAFILVLVIWGSWHWLMQTYGLVRIYDAKAKNFDPMSARLDYALCILWFGVIYWNTDGATGVLMRFYRAGGVLPSSVAAWGVRIWLAMTVGVSCFYLIHLIRRWRAGHPPSPLKLLLLAITSVFYFYAFGLSSSHLVAYALFEGYHDIQYLAIVWVFNRNRADKDPSAGRFTRFLFQRRAPLIVLYVLLCLGFGSYDFFARKIDDEVIAKTALGFVTGAALVHFYFDGFIWRIRESSTSSTLGVEGGKNKKLIPRIPPNLRHGLLWAILGIPVVALGVWETSGARVEDADAYKAVLKVKPKSHKAHFMLSQELEKKGETNEALTHVERSRELRPGYDVYDMHYADLLLASRADELSESELDEVIRCYENAARNRPALTNLHFNWGLALHKRNRLPEAEARFRRATELDPTSSEAYYQLAQVLAKQKSFQQAADASLEAVNLDPDSLDAVSLSAQLYMQVGRPDIAKTNFRRAIEIDPTNVDNITNFAFALATLRPPLRDLELAAKLATQAEKLLSVTEIPSEWERLSQVYFFVQNLEKATESANRAINLYKETGNQSAADALTKIVQNWQQQGR